MRSIALLGVALVTQTGPMAGEQASAIEFAPTAGLRVHTIYVSTGSIQFVGFPGLADTSMGAYEAVLGMTQRFVRPLDGAWQMDVTWDSSRARYRAAPDGEWLDLETPVSAVGPVPTRVNARLAQTPNVEPEDDWTVRLLRGLRGVVDLVLPDRPLASGTRWSDVVAMPYAVELPGDPPTLLNVVLSGRATVVVDSVVPRAADTLAYVSLQAGLNPLRLDTAYVEPGLELPVTIWGSVGSTMVWSSGWDAWATGTSTLRMHHRVETGPEVGREITASSTVTTNFRIRP